MVMEAEKERMFIVVYLSKRAAQYRKKSNEIKNEANSLLYLELGVELLKISDDILTEVHLKME